MPYPEGVQDLKKGTPTRGSVTTAGAIVAANPNRIALIIVNNSATTCYIGPGADVTGANGIPLAQNASFTDNVTTGGWWVSGSSIDLRYIEVA